MSEGAPSPRRRGSRFTLVTLAVFSLLPIWPAWYFSLWEGLEKPASFWTMLASVPRALEHHSPATLLTRCYGPDVIPPTVLLCVCLFAGRRLAGWSRRVAILSTVSARILALALFLLARPPDVERDELGEVSARILALALFLLAASLFVALGR